MLYPAINMAYSDNIKPHSDFLFSQYDNTVPYPNIMNILIILNVIFWQDNDILYTIVSSRIKSNITSASILWIIINFNYNNILTF